MDQIQAAAKRLNVNLPDGWKAELVRQIVTVWAKANPSDVSDDILDRAASLFDAINKRFSQFDQRAA